MSFVKVDIEQKIEQKRTEDEQFKKLWENTENMTVVIISQRVSAIQGADHILVLYDGAPAGYGTHEELLSSSQVYQEICASQSAGKSKGKEATANA